MSEQRFPATCGDEVVIDQGNVDDRISIEFALARAGDDPWVLMTRQQAEAVALALLRLARGDVP